MKRNFHGIYGQQVNRVRNLAQHTPPANVTDETPQMPIGLFSYDSLYM